MNPRTALRQADPARHLTPQEPDELLLSEILGSTPPQTESAPGRYIESSKRDRRPLIVTGVVAVAVVGVAVAAVRVPAASNSEPASTITSRQALENTVFAELNEVATGDLPVRQKSAVTWSDTSPGGDGGALDLTDRTLYIAAACDGGGTIAIRLTGHKDQTLTCTTLSTLGPIDLTAEISSANGTAGLDVVVTSGHPRYIATLMAFPTPTTTPTPR